MNDQDYETLNVLLAAHKKESMRSVLAPGDKFVPNSKQIVVDYRNVKSAIISFVEGVESRAREKDATCQ